METQYPLKKIEFVCTANHGRSIPSEIISNQHLREIGASYLYQAISSGTSVDDIAAGNLRPEVMVGFVKKGLERGIYDETEIGEITKGDLALNAALKTYFGKAAQIFEHEEHASRNKALEGYFERKKQKYESEGVENRVELLDGLYQLIEQGLSKKPDQTVVRDDVIAIFPMAASNLKGVKSIYGQAGRETPYVFGTPKAFVLKAHNAMIPDCFGEKEDKYVEMFADLVKYIPRATVKGIFYALAHDLAMKMDINNPANQKRWVEEARARNNQ